MKNKKFFVLYYCLSLFILSPGLSQAQGINITSGSSIVSSGATTIEINNGGLINNGTYTKGTETITFSGTTAGTISGSSTTSLNNLVITNTGGIILVAGTAVTAANLTTTGATFIVNSDDSNNGSLIVSGTSAGNVTYNRWMTKDKWHLVSSPVGGTVTSFISANLAYLATNATKYGLAAYDNTIPNWSFYTTGGTSDNFIAGKGYEILRQINDEAFSFTGTVATDNVSIGITTPVSPGNPWNLVGNPYLSAINGANVGTNFFTVNSAALGSGEYQALYVWDAANSTYLTINNTSGATYIAPGQAFFVYSVAGGGTINFTEAMQTHQTGDIFKSGEISYPSIKLIAERSKGMSSTNIKYFEGTTPGLDPGYDAGRFSAGDNSFAVYTHLVGDESNTVDFDIQCLPQGEYKHVIPVGLNCPANTEMVFRAEAMNLLAAMPVILEDRQSGTFTDLTQTGSFYAVTIKEKTEGTGRYYLHTEKSAVTGIGAIGNEMELTIIPRPQYNCLHVVGNTGNNAEISVYDMLGRKLINKKLNARVTSEVEMGALKSGAYVVFIRSESQNVSKKISWIKQ